MAYFKTGTALACSAILSFQVSAKDLRTEYQDTQPKYILSGERQTGICVDILKALTRELAGQEIRIRLPKGFVPPKRIRSNLVEGKTDLHCGAARNSDREKQFFYSKIPLYEIRNVVLGRRDEKVDVSSPADLRTLGSQILSVRGTSSQKLLNDEFGVNSPRHPKSMANAFLMLDRGRMRFFFYHDLGLLWELKVRGLKDKYRVFPTTFRRYHHWMIYSRSLDDSLREKIEAALNRLHKSGEIERILSRYRPGP